LALRISRVRAQHRRCTRWNHHVWRWIVLFARHCLVDRFAVVCGVRDETGDLGKRGKTPGCARTSWRSPAGERPAQVRGSARLVASVARPSVTAAAKRTQQLHGVCIEPRKFAQRGGRDSPGTRRQYVWHRYARCRHSTVVADHITCKRNSSEPGRSRV